MCWTKSRQSSRGLAAVLSLSLLVSLPISVSAEEAYEITAEELTRLETTLTQQSETIETQRQTLTRLRSTIDEQGETLTRLSTTIETQHETIAQLSTSFEEYEREARNRTIRAALYGGIGGLAGGAICALILAY